MSVRALCSAMLLAVGACGDDDEPETDDPIADSAYAITQRILNPDGARFLGVNLVSSLDAQELQLDQGFEFSGFSRVRVIDDRVFVFESERGEIIRYRVTPTLRLEEESRLSLGELGVVSFSGSVVLDTPTRGYIADADERIVIFDPNAMTLVGEMNFEGIQREGFPNAETGLPARLGDELYVPVTWSNTATLEFLPRIAVAVFSLTEQRFLRLVEDDRCGHNTSGFVHDGAYYAVGDLVSGIGNLFLPDTAPPPCLVRLEAEASDFDPDYFVDLSTAIGRPVLSEGAVGLGDGRFVVMVFDSPDELSSFNLSSFLDSNIWRWALIEVPSGRAEILNELPLSAANGVFQPSLIDGAPYVAVFADDTSSTELFRVDDVSAPTPSVRNPPGQIVRVDRVF